MIALIKKLEEKGFTYMAGGNIYFSIYKFPDYGKLALLDKQKLFAGARIEVDDNKKNPHDFVLWFTKSKFANQTMVWDSPWGKGYPGWHIECSAMGIKYLGESFDIHCGGIDHINVHHTNEIAQSEAATGKSWVKYWLHGEFLVMNKAKMAKSAGNFLTLEDLKKQGYEPLDYRYFCLTGHYRSQLQFSWESLDSAKNAMINLAEKIKQLYKEIHNKGEQETENSLDRISIDAKKYLDNFKEAIWDDINCPKALAVLWTTLKENNITAKDKLALIFEFDKIFGLNLKEKACADKKFSCDADIDLVIKTEVESLLLKRSEARKNKDFKTADTIRDKLKNMGIEIKDTTVGTTWKKV
jgi:cysteinyl-tRNA synthetase